MPLSLSELQTPVTKESVREVILNDLTCAQFPVDSWQDEGAARSFVETQAHLVAVQSQAVATIAAMCFLSTATGEFLDALVQSHWGLTRNAAVQAVFDVVLDNQGNTTHGPLAAGAILLRASNGSIFESTEAATLTAGAETTVEFRAQLAGADGNVTAQDLELVTPLAGVVAEYDGALITAGTDAESDVKLRERAAAQWGLLRVEKIESGLVALARGAASSIHGVSVDADNPRGPGTVDVYLSAPNATAASSDVDAVQTALDSALFGTGTEEPAGLAVAAPTQTVDLSLNVYVRGASSEEVQTRLADAWEAFLLEVPLGGFDLSPGPTNTIGRDQISTYLVRTAYPSTSPIVSLDVATPSDDVTVAEHTKVLAGTVTINVFQLTS